MNGRPGQDPSPRQAAVPPGGQEGRAAETRRTILDAAEQLFAQQGYPATTIAQLARTAGVGTNTVYLAFGNKPSIVAALIERATDAPIGVESEARVARAPTGQQVIAELAHGTRIAHERFHETVLLGLDTARADPLISAAMAAGISSYRDRLRHAVVRLEELSALMEPLTVPQAVDLMWFYLGLPPWRTLIEMGWTWDDAETFLTAQATQAVVSPSSPRAR